MRKKTFIPINYRPKLKGDQLQTTENLLNESEFCSIVNHKCAIVCLYVKDDGVQTRAIQSSIGTSREICFLCYDDLGQTWNFSYQDKKLLFYYCQETIEPIGIYNRPYHPELTHPNVEMFEHLLQALEVWDGSFIGGRLGNFHNSSKAFQMTTSIESAILKSCSDMVKAPRSFFIKGCPLLLEQLLEKEGCLIVKSCSGIRSKVVCNKTFSMWQQENLFNLPTFFQVYADGPDIRVHVLDQNEWAVKIQHKDSVDYRYAENTSEYEVYNLPEKLVRFCHILSQLEQNRLIGIDFIKVHNTFFCLESNPSPGWASFFPDNNLKVKTSQLFINCLASLS